MDTTAPARDVTPTPHRWLRSSALVGAGLVLGAGLMAGTTATAATDDSSDATRQGEESSAPVRPHEELLTGDVAEQVEAAVLEAYPGATIHRLETDSDGVYEAHLMTAEGERVVVALDESFAITGETVGGPGGRGGRGPGGPGCDDGTATSEDGTTTEDGTEATPSSLTT